MTAHLTQNSISTLQGEVEVLKANSDSAATEIDNLTQQLATEQKRRLQAEQHLALLQQSGSAPDTFAQALTKWLGPPPASPPAAALSEQVDQMVGQLKDQKI
jgi:predicted  nucleic acid-binding Zn-ribbon protein